MRVNEIQKSTGQSGFTLIEIIAVLVILGILAAVATPKFINLQEEARKKAAEGACAAAASQLNLNFSKQLLISNGDVNAAYTALTSPSTDAWELGDYNATAIDPDIGSLDNSTQKVTFTVNGPDISGYTCSPVAAPGYQGN